MKDEEFLKLVLTLEGLSRAILEVRDELHMMNEEGLVIFVGQDHLEN